MPGAYYKVVVTTQTGRVHGGRLGFALAAMTMVGAAVLAQSGNGPSRSRGARPYTQWTAYGGGSHSSQYSALDQINKTNVSQLQVAWTYPVTGNVIFNPIVIDNVMYVQGSGNAIVALDAATGKELWTHPNMGGIGARGDVELEILGAAFAAAEVEVNKRAGCAGGGRRVICIP